MAETNGRQASEAPSSSSSDLYTAQTAEPTNMQPTATNGNTMLQKHAQVQPLPDLEDDGDLSSEMDVSDDSSSTASADPVAGPSHAGAKRKLSDVDTKDASALPIAQDAVKKPRMSIPLARPGPNLLMTAGWPPELWQQVFAYLSPAMLSRCLRVCRSFKFCLTQLKATNLPRKRNAPIARVLDSEALWTQSRKHTYNTMPRPLQGFSELEMLQLFGGASCQSCGKPHVKSPVTNVFNAGPGENGVRVIWPFRARLCGKCFTNQSLTDIQMLSTKHPAAPLTRGLPYAFRTPDAHFIPDHIRQSSNGLPVQTRLHKTFYTKDVDNITEEVEEVNSFGDGAADEWRKGMTQRGKDAMADSSRWERWEGSMPLGKALAEVLREYDLASFPRLLEQQQRQQRQVTGQYAHVNCALPAPPFNGTHPLPQPVHVFANTQPPMQQHHAPPPGLPAPQTQRPVRNAHEVEAARQARRADIERRCLELDPPLQANALQHIKAFRDTMQITTPMTDAQWENMLKPKILEDREAAELQEHQRAQQLAALQAAIPSTVPDEAFTRPAKEVYDRDYEQSQEPLRLKLGEYASDHINGHWLQGRSLDRDSAPLFAVDVLLHVRSRYIADKEAGNLTSVIQGAPKFHLAKQSTPPLEPFLSLDNMKWVFDNKVRTHTESLRRELFICAGCFEDVKPKWFAFEGLIQHYGAKHTSAFSKGNVVVHWQTAEWPDEPPFFENPASFVKVERKFSGGRSHGRARGTAQGNFGDTVQAPTQVAALSDHPTFSTGPASASAQNGHHPAHHTPGNHGFQTPPAQPRADLGQEVQVAKISSDAREIWDQLDGVKDLREALECVRMQTVIHHVVNRFVERFAHVPHLDLLTDALATNELMKPIKSTHALVCKMCTAEQTDGTADQISYYARIRKMKLYNISALVTHFKLNHQPHGALEWDRDLIELPDTPLVGELIRKPGMDDNKLALIASAFPSAFPSPLPHIGTVPDGPPKPGPDSGLASRLVKKLTKGQQQSKKKKKAQNHTRDRTRSIEPSTDSREEEYDPRRPMFVDKKPAELDLSRFDTDLARKDEPPRNGIISIPDSFNLAPETLAALNSLQAQIAARPEPEMRYRSPSIRRSESRPTSAQYTAPPPSHPQITPEIAAMLASLTGQPPGAAASATSSSTPNHGSSHTPRQPHEPYARPTQQIVPTYTRPESHRPQSHYAPGGSYPSSVEPPPAQHNGQDLQAALTRNAQHYAHNGNTTYVEPASAPAPAPIYAAPPHHRSPPRYRVVYEDEPPYAQPQPQPHAYPQPQYHHQPYDGHPAPIQYVPIPEPYRAYDPYAPQPPKPIYVDQYGRPVELIPIDAAPAPVQYVPHLYDQQQQQQYARPAAYAGAPQFSAPPPQHQHQQHQPQGGYYEQAPPMGMQQGRYVYEDEGRGSVPRG